MKKNIFLKNRCLSFKFAFNGIISAFKSQFNLKIHFIASIIAILTGFYLEISYYEWAIIILVIGMVISAELINTSIESIVDLISPQYHESAKMAKDTSAGAVLIMAIVAFFVGFIIFVPKILTLIVQK